MTESQKERSRRPRVAVVASQKGGEGKTLLATSIADLHYLHDEPIIAVQIDDQQRLARTIGQDVITVNTETVRASRTNPAASIQAFRPMMTALEQAASLRAMLLVDIGGTQVRPTSAFASLSELSGDMVEMGFEGRVFVPATAEPEAINQAARTIAMLSESLPVLKAVLVENRRDGAFDTLATGSEAYRALRQLREASPDLPEIVMPAVEGGSWRYFEPHYCRPIDVVAMDVGEVMRLTGLPRAEARIARGDVAAWVAEMERALAPLLGLPEVFR